MIAHLKGLVIETGEEVITLDVNGVGYEVSCSAMTLEHIAATNGPVQVWVQTIVREDAFLLFGFSTPAEKRLFNAFLKVNGVGPKSAQKILSAASSLDSLMGMIEAGDVKGLSGLPKVGKKTAEQVILTLKGKLVLDSGERPVAKAAPLIAAGFAGDKADIFSALVNLGFRGQDVERVVLDLPEDIDLGAGIRVGLQALTQGSEGKRI